MKQRKTILIVGLLVLVIGGLALNNLFSPKNLLEKYDREIQNLKEDIVDMNRSITDYYKSKGKIQPNYPFLDPDKTKTFRQLIDKMFIIKKKLARAYEQKGDYYLDELYRLDKNSPDKYKKYKSVRGVQDLRNAILSKKPIAKETINMMIETRQLALNNFHLATKALDDETSDLYKVKKNFLPVILDITNRTPLIIINRNNKLSQTLAKSQSSNKKRLKKIWKQYHVKRVDPNLHYKKGKCHYQLTIFTYHSILVQYLNKENNHKKEINDLTEKKMNSIAFKLAFSSMKKHLNLAEKEYLIALGVYPTYPLAIYNLAELYTYRYLYFEKISKRKEKNLLKKGEILLKKMLVLSIINKDDYEKERKKYGNLKREKAFFLLGQIYYLMGRKKEALSIYKNLMGVFSEKSTLFSDAARNYNSIKSELQR